MLKVSAEMKRKASDPPTICETLLVIGVWVGLSGVQIPAQTRDLFYKTTRPGEPDPNSYSMSTGGSLGVKRLGRDDGHSPTSSRWE
jgi:hypothetical protein